MDASLVVKWLVEEEDSRTAVALADSWYSSGMQPVAPPLMAIEVANALYRRVVRGELGVANAARLLENLLASGVELRDTPGLLARTLELSLQPRQGAVYDSHYLALAEALGCELWTADERFFRAAVSLTPNVHRLGEFVASE